ncbi:hypothetical protein BE20_11975 [Sorangium cellulosum]|nr:hypothetical protein BE20_11975 [Sorangium cellulosum]
MMESHRIRRIRLVALMFVLATFSAAGAARAEDAGARAGAPAERRFGGRGQVAFDNVVGVTTEGGHLGPHMVADVGLVYQPWEHIYLHMAPELVLRLTRVESSRGGALRGSASLELGFTGGIGVLLGS